VLCIQGTSSAARKSAYSLEQGLSLVPFTAAATTGGMRFSDSTLTSKKAVPEGGFALHGEHDDTPFVDSLKQE
jgi:hypothetical protein